MFRVLIAEDEMLIRMGLKNSIEWSRFNMSVIADAANGQAAWEIYLREKPDIIITDLQMPMMGGMELISKIREIDRDTKIIILTSLEEFSLIRQAMSYGVSDYILKMTMTEEEMETVLSKIQDELNEKKNRSLASLCIDSLSRDVVREKFLKDYLFYNIYSLKEFTDHVTEAGFRISSSHLTICKMEIDHFEALKAKFNDGKGQLVKSSILNILDEILLRNARGEVFSDTDSNYILIFSFQDTSSEQDMYNELYAILNNIKSSLSTFLEVKVSFGVSSINNGYSQLGKMYQEASLALDNKFFLGAGIFLAQNKTDFDKLIVEKIEGLRNQSMIPKMLSDSEKKDFNIKFDAFINVYPKTKEQIQMFFGGMLQYVSAILNSKEDYNAMLVMKYNHKLLKCETLDEVIKTFNGFVSEITIKVIKKEILSKEISQALKYIRNNYWKDLNLPQVAEYVKLSPNYLGNLFKKELKVNFIEYLNELRIAKAKELLMGTYLKSYEVADRVGFTEHTYFSKVFKKIVGLSPNEFKKNLLKDRSEYIENRDDWAI